MKKLIMLALAAGLNISLTAIDLPLNDINILNKTDDHVFFVAWRGSGFLSTSKSDYERILPEESKNSSSVGRSTLQAELGATINDVQNYKKKVNSSQIFKVTGSRITITVDENNMPTVIQEGTLSGNLKTVEIKNNSDRVLFIAWTRKLDVGIDLGKYKSSYSRFVPSKDSKQFHTAFNIGDSIQIEVGQKANKDYDKLIKKSNKEITKKRVNLNVDANGMVVITQE